jgi:LemA protein
LAGEEKIDNRFQKKLLLLSLLSLFLFSAGCGYNSLQAQDEEVKAAWSQVQNQYQRRADLVPNLVETVKGFAAQEQKVLTDVVEARSKVGQVNLSPEITQNPEAFKQFEASQNQLTGALSRLMVVVEQYPELKSNQNFLNLQAQLEGTENRIAVARRDYIEAVRRFNTAVRSFPTNLTAKFLGLNTKENFTAEAAAQETPKVKF